MSLRRLTVAGALWLFIQNIVSRLIGFASQLVTAELLVPQDFGIVGMAFTASAVGAVIANAGLDQVLVQRHRTMHLWLAPALVVTFGLGLLALVVTLMLGLVASALYGVDVTLLAAIVALSMPFSALGIVPSMLIRSELAFRRLAWTNVLEIIGIQGLTIVLAYSRAGPYALVVPLPVMSLLKTILLWALVRPDVNGGWRRVRRGRILIARTTAAFGIGLLQAAIAQGDYIALSLQGSERAVGVYFLAYKLGSQPLVVLSSSLTGVLFPALSRLRTQPGAQTEAIFRAVRMMSLLVMPVAFLQTGLVPDAIHILLPSKWYGSIPVIRILSVGLGIASISWVANTVLTARAGFNAQLRYSAICAPIFFVFVSAGAESGSSVGVARGVAAYCILVTPVISHLSLRRAGIRLASLARIYLISVTLSAFSVTFGVLVANALPGSEPAIRLVTIVILSTIALCRLGVLSRPAGLSRCTRIAHRIVPDILSGFSAAVHELQIGRESWPRQP